MNFRGFWTATTERSEKKSGHKKPGNSRGPRVTAVNITFCEITFCVLSLAMCFPAVEPAAASDPFSRFFFSCTVVTRLDKADSARTTTTTTPQTRNAAISCRRHFLLLQPPKIEDSGLLVYRMCVHQAPAQIHFRVVFRVIRNRARFASRRRNYTLQIT